MAEADGETLDSEQLRYQVLSTDYDEADLLELFGDLCFSPVETGAALYAWYEDNGGDTPLNKRIAKEGREIKAAPHKWAIVGRGVCEVYAFRGEWHRAHPKRNKTFLGKLKGSDLFDSQADAQRELQRRKALIAEIEDLTAGGYIVYNTNKLHKESTKVLEMFLRELKS